MTVMHLCKTAGQCAKFMQFGGGPVISRLCDDSKHAAAVKSVLMLILTIAAVCAYMCVYMCVCGMCVCVYVWVWVGVWMWV